MQRMFAFLMESERKAYSPEAFCRVYEMNNQTLNPTEQKDMMEFFSDLVSKMEEMSPGSRDVFKRLFTGTVILFLQFKMKFLKFFSTKNPLSMRVFFVEI